MAVPSTAGAQGRLVEHYRASDPEGRLIAYYTAAMTFSSLGAPTSDRRWSVAIEGTWLPSLSAAQRRPGIDKPESTNLAPLLPRPRITVRTALAIVEASWIPPITVGDARANLVAAAVSRPVARWHMVVLTPRVSMVAGRVRGSITCNAGTASEGGQDLALYYATVCHGNESDDWFEPRIAAGEVVASRQVSRGQTHGFAWLAAGGRLDRSRFDIGVQRADGTRDLDHPIVALRDARPHVAAGLRWPLTRRLASAVEWFYAPGSVATLRALLSVDAGMR